MKKVAMFVFNGSPMCFVHVLLNALDMSGRGEEVRIVMEGGATKLVPKLENPGHSLHALWKKTRDKGLVAGACRACSRKLGVLDASVQAGLPLLDDMNGHPAMAGFQDAGYEIVTF
ncbi:MAG: DsrE family protein [Desulfobacterales bacterium]